MANRTLHPMVNGGSPDALDFKKPRGLGAFSNRAMRKSIGISFDAGGLYSYKARNKSEAKEKKRQCTNG